jgi:hypothetical protein
MAQNQQPAQGSSPMAQGGPLNGQNLAALMSQQAIPQGPMSLGGALGNLARQQPQTSPTSSTGVATPPMGAPGQGAGGGKGNMGQQIAQLPGGPNAGWNTMKPMQPGQNMMQMLTGMSGPPKPGAGTPGGNLFQNMQRQAGQMAGGGAARGAPGQGAGGAKGAGQQPQQMKQAMAQLPGAPR